MLAMQRLSMTGSSWLLVLAGTLGSLACGAPDATKPPSGEVGALRIQIEGSGQRAFAGQTLDQPIVAEVVDSLLRAVPGQRRVRVSVVAGGGLVSDTALLSDENGRAAVNWTLGKSAGTQELAMSLPDSPTSGEQRAQAVAVSVDAADVVLMTGATSGSIGVLVRQDDGVVPHTLVWPDTILRLLPRTAQGTWEEVTAFTTGHPPVSVLHPWTDAVDTVRLAFSAPIEVPFTIWITHDFDTTAARARHDLDALDTFWRSHMIGLRVGRVRVDSAPNLLFICNQGTPASYDAATINVYYMDYRGNPDTCSAHIIRMAGNNPQSFADEYSLILAHEVGHAMALNHVSETRNVMYPGPDPPPGSGLTTGQIYWMHFDAAGALNSIVGVHPAAERNCQLPLFVHCPPQTFAVW